MVDRATLLADLEAEHRREAVSLSQPALERVTDATRPADTELRDRRITVTLRAASSSSPVAIEYNGVRVGQADHNDAAEIHNTHLRQLRKGVTAQAVMFRDNDRWRLRYTSPRLTPSWTATAAMRGTRL